MSFNVTTTSSATKLTVTFSVVMALIMPVGYGVVSYKYLMGSLEAEAEINSKLVSTIISTNPELWRYETIRIEELLARRPRSGVAESRRIFDQNNNVVAESVNSLQSPQVKASHELIESGEVVGKIEISRSLRSILLQTGIVALLGMGFGLLLYRWLPFKDVIKAGKKLQDTNDFLMKVMECSTNSLVVLDLAGNIQMFNGRFETLTGCSRGDLVGHSFCSLFTGDAQSEINDKLREVTTGRLENITFDTQLSSQHGSVLSLDCGAVPLIREGRINGVVVSLNDITEYRQAEEALRLSEERFRSIFEQSLDAIFNTIPDGTVINANPAACRMFGMSVQELCRAGRAGVMDTDDPRFAPALEERIRTGRINAELSCIRSNGERFPAEVSSVVSPGAPPRSFVIIRDITERKRAEQELLDKNTELERFTYTVSHDLKSPLITIQSFAGMIKEDLEAGQMNRISDDLGKIVDAAAKMGTLLDDLLKLSRAGQAMSPPSAIDTECLVEEVLAQLAGPLKQKRVEVVVQRDLPSVHGDRQRIALVLQNLVENAIKYMGDQDSPRIGIGARKDGTETVCFVSDNGSGVDPRYHEKIFGLFTKLDLKSQGTGVGLALVKRVIEVHGGRVWVESDGAGKGSTFCFTFPNENDQSGKSSNFAR